MENETAPDDVSALASLKYLTVQDLIWINLQATKKVRHFNYARLEEATFYQYGYGASKDLKLQAGRFLSGFMKLRPFDAGNEATAFIGCSAFLLLNDRFLDLPDSEAAGWLEKVRDGAVRAEEAIAALIVENRDAHRPLASNVRDSVRIVLETFPKTLASLSDPMSQSLAS